MKLNKAWRESITGTQTLIVFHLLLFFSIFSFKIFSFLQMMPFKMYNGVVVAVVLYDSPTCRRFVSLRSWEKWKWCCGGRQRLKRRAKHQMEETNEPNGTKANRTHSPLQQFSFPLLFFFSLSFTFSLCFFSFTLPSFAIFPATTWTRKHNTELFLFPHLPFDFGPFCI